MTRQGETRQEQIRKEVADKIKIETVGGYLEHWSDFRDQLTEAQQREYFLRIATTLLENLALQGGVLKVERELPETLIDELEYGNRTCADFRWGVSACQKDMKEAGFTTAVEPLI